MHFVQAKSLLSAHNGMNLYRGCVHGCIYCDTRSDCYQFRHPFEDIEVKENAPALLEDALRRKRRPCMISTGAMCDPYMPCEEELGLTRRCLELIEQYGFGVSVQTKSARILRDIDLFDRINRKTKAVAEMTLTTANEELCRLIEPNVSTTRERYLALKAFQARGIPTVVWLCPILPFLNDTEENLRGILDYCFDAGVRGVICFGFGVTLRSGDREYFYRQLDRHFPGLSDRYRTKFGNAYECASDNSEALWRVFDAECEKHGVMYHADEIFRYLSEFPETDGQIGMFD